MGEVLMHVSGVIIRKYYKQDKSRWSLQIGYGDRSSLSLSVPDDAVGAESLLDLPMFAPVTLHVRVATSIINGLNWVNVLEVVNIRS